MQIENNQEIKAFIQRCKDNMSDDRINSFIGLSFKKTDENKIQKALNKIKVPEFMKEPYPSLIIPCKEYTNTPYHKNVHLDKISNANYTLTTDIISAYKLFNVSFVQPDPNRELHDTLMLRAFDEDYPVITLTQNGVSWMNDNPSEANTIDPCAKKAHGNIVTFGLGIGYFVYMALLNPSVNSITVVEYSQQVIDMFNQYLLPQFPDNKPIKIIQGDGFKYFNEPFLQAYDYAFIDIWKSIDDGLVIINKMLEQYLPPIDKVDFWIEDNCIDMLRGLMLYYFDLLVNHRKITHPDKQLNTFLIKINNYFRKLDIVISKEEQLKFYLYDKQTFRNILANK